MQAPTSDKHLVEAAENDLPTVERNDSICNCDKLLACIKEQDITVSDCCELIAWAVRMQHETLLTMLLHNTEASPTSNGKTPKHIIQS
jgi:hypothetical protein